MNASEGIQRGLFEKERILTAMEDKPWVVRAREVAKDLARFRPITIEDVYQVVGEPPKPNQAGAVFRHYFRKSGEQPSSKPEAHGRLIRRWTLKPCDCGHRYSAHFENGQCRYKSSIVGCGCWLYVPYDD